MIHKNFSEEEETIFTLGSINYEAVSCLTRKKNRTYSANCRNLFFAFLRGIFGTISLVSKEMKETYYENSTQRLLELPLS